MLARLAENLFWAGRYVERANDTARLLDVTYHGGLEATDGERTRMWRDLLDVLAQHEVSGELLDAVHSGGIPHFLVVDRDNPASIVSAAERLRENIRSLREHVSTELWEAVNLLWLDLNSRDLAVDLDREAYTVLSAVKRHCQTIMGAADETMSRDDGWRFFALGRQLERAIMTCRLIRGSLAPIVDARSEVAFHHWVVLLKSAGGLQAFRSEHQPHASPADAIAFLLVNDSFPRSVRFSVDRASGYVDSLRFEEPSLSARVIGRLSADLEYCDVRMLVAMSEIEPFLSHVLSSVQLAVDAVSSEFFREAEPTSLSVQRF